MSRVARRLNLNRSSVGEWRDKGIPLAHCAVVEEECSHEFTRRDFRPNDWQVIWPELAAEDAQRQTEGMG